MKQKYSIAVVSVIWFILLCNSIFAEDEKIYDLREGEDLVQILTYVGGYYYEFCLLTKGNTKENIVTIRSIPKKAYDIKVYSYKDTKRIETEYVKIKNKEELRNFFDVYPAVNEHKFFEHLEKSLAHENILIGIIFPEDLNVDGEFKIEVLSKIRIDEQIGESYYGYDKIRIKFSGNIEDLDRFSFVLRNGYRFWYRNGGTLERTEENEEILSWQFSKNNIRYLYITFGTPEERLHWENYINNIENFIYVMLSIFFTFILTIFFANFKKYSRTKYIVLFIVVTIFKILFTKRIDNFSLKKIPIETCLGGSCLIDKIDTISKILLSIQIILGVYFIFLVFRLFKDRAKENPKKKNGKKIIHQNTLNKIEKNISKIKNSIKIPNINFQITFGEDIGKNLSNLFLLFFSLSSAMIFSRYFSTWEGSVFLYAQRMINGLNSANFWYTTFACLTSIGTLILSFFVALWFMNWLKNKVKDATFWLLFSKYLPLVFIISLAPLCSFWIGTSILSGLDNDYLCLINNIGPTFKWSNSTYIFAYIELVLLLAILYTKVPEEKSLYTIFTLPIAFVITFIFFYISSKLLALGKYSYLGVFNFIILIFLCLILGYIYLKYTNRSNA